MWVVAVATVVGSAWAAYVITVEIIARRNIAEFSQRPEVENWALPYLGTEGPAMVVAVCVAILVTAIWVVAWAMSVRARQRAAGTLGK
ncbi:hypothetical protein [Microbacterium sp. NPDC058389]|uniref:hypothetical protein n=1 Tax=Microbacterium sp. NPDC058389 TaxID=3346475 RepID=UPI00364962F2